MDRTEWLAGLKAGDEVAVVTAHTAEKRLIDRATSATIFIGGLKFRRIDGIITPKTGYNYSRIRQFSDYGVATLIVKTRCRNIVAQLGRVAGELPEDESTLARLEAALKALKGEQDGIDK